MEYRNFRGQRSFMFLTHGHLTQHLADPSLVCLVTLHSFSEVSSDITFSIRSFRTGPGSVTLSLWSHRVHDSYRIYFICSSLVCPPGPPHHTMLEGTLCNSATRQSCLRQPVGTTEAKAPSFVPPGTWHEVSRTMSVCNK